MNWRKLAEISAAITRLASERGDGRAAVVGTLVTVGLAILAGMELPDGEDRAGRVTWIAPGTELLSKDLPS